MHELEQFGTWIGLRRLAWKSFYASPYRQVNYGEGLFVTKTGGRQAI